MALQEAVFWLADAPQPAAIAETALPPAADVVVIGAGYTGLSAALRLAKQGASVVVLEQHHLGWGASSRNGGQVLTGLKHGVVDLIRTHSKEKAQALFQASLRAITCVEDLIASEQIECQYVRSGHLEAACKPAHFRALQETQAVLAQEFDHPTTLLAPAELPGELGSSFYHGALLDERSGSLQPAQYVLGLAQAARRSGAILVEQTAAQALRRTPGGFEVQTGRGVVRCQHVFVATNGYTARLTPQFQRRILPIGSYIIATAPLSPELAQRLLPRRRLVFDTKNLLYYFRLSPDNRMIFGGRAAFFPSTPATTRTSARMLQQDLGRVFPELAGALIEYAWGGTLGVTMDLFPHAGCLEGVWYAMGYAGHGVAMATYLGQQMADRMLGKPADNPFAGLDFPPVPLYSGNPWFLPFVAAWYRFLDLVS